MKPGVLSEAPTTSRTQAPPERANGVKHAAGVSPLRVVRRRREAPSSAGSASGKSKNRPSSVKVGSPVAAETTQASSCAVVGAGHSAGAVPSALVKTSCGASSLFWRKMYSRLTKGCETAPSSRCDEATSGQAPSRLSPALQAFEGAPVTPKKKRSWSLLLSIESSCRWF